MKTLCRISLIIIISVFAIVSFVYAGTEESGLSTQKTLNRLYSDPERSVTVTIHESKKLHTVPNGFLGINLSYFNITDEIWQKYDLLVKLKKAGIKALRYPGGEETSFFHWEHPGVNGYEDIWDPKDQHGVALKRGRFQATWVPPERWDTNEDFMSCLLYTSPSPRDLSTSRMPSSA